MFIIILIVLFFDTCTGKRGNPWFNLALSGRTSNDIHINSTAAEFEEELRKLFAWECHYQTPPDRALYYSGFEVEPNWPEPGDRVMEPYCGRNALKNPSVLFRGGQTKDMYGRILRGFDVSRYRQVSRQGVLVCDCAFVGTRDCSHEAGCRCANRSVTRSLGLSLPSSK